MACRGCSSGTGCTCSVVGSADSVITVAGDGTAVTNPYKPTFHGNTWLAGLTVNDATACASLNNPHVPVLLGDGSVISRAFPCVTATNGHFGGNAFAFTYATATADADPGDGLLRFNNATIASATVVYVDDMDCNSTDIQGWKTNFVAGGRLKFYSQSDSTKWATFQITVNTDAVGYTKFTVVLIDANGSAFATTPCDLVMDYTPPGAGVAAGGATGAFLTKNSATDFDTVWVTGIPLGCKGVHSLTTAFATASTHTTFQDEGLTLTLNDVISRRWKFTLIVNPYVSGGANSVSYKLLRDGVAIHQWNIPTEALSTTVDHGITLTHTEVIAATHASSVYKVQFCATVNNTAVNSLGSAGTPRQLVIEDIGV